MPSVAAADRALPVKLSVPLVASVVMAALQVTASVALRMPMVARPLAAQQLAAKRLAGSVVTLKATPLVESRRLEPRLADLRQLVRALVATLVTAVLAMAELELVETPPARPLEPTRSLVTQSAAPQLPVLMMAAPPPARQSTWLAMRLATMLQD